MMTYLLIGVAAWMVIGLFVTITWLGKLSYMSITAPLVEELINQRVPEADTHLRALPKLEYTLDKVKAQPLGFLLVCILFWPVLIADSASGAISLLK